MLEGKVKFHPPNNWFFGLHRSLPVRVIEDRKNPFETCIEILLRCWTSASQWGDCLVSW
jgi:hypothetical protein